MATRLPCNSVTTQRWLEQEHTHKQLSKNYTTWYNRIGNELGENNSETKEGLDTSAKQNSATTDETFKQLSYRNKAANSDNNLTQNSGHRRLDSKRRKTHWNQHATEPRHTNSTRWWKETSCYSTQQLETW